jgi:hypothetical protein
MASSKSNAIVGRHLFRMIMRHARHFDKHQARKAVGPLHHICTCAHSVFLHLPSD